MKSTFTFSNKSLYYILLSCSFSSLVYFKSNAQDFPTDNRNIRISANLPAKEPVKSDELFVGGSGYDYDRYLYRKDLANGRLKLGVDITRFYTNAMQFDSQGFLTNAPELIKKGLIPAKAFLALNIFDVDDRSQYDGNGDGIADPEVDHVYVNGNLIKLNGEVKKLTSGDQTWSTFSCYIPIEYLKFPTRIGDENNSPKAENIVEIDVDVPNTTYWAVQCNWVSIEIKNTIRPLVLVRGYGPFGLGNALETWKTFIGFIERDGISYHLATSIDPGWAIYKNADILQNEITIAKKTFGVEKVNIIAHSKGGLDSRFYLRTHSDVENLVQLGTPNHGSAYAIDLFDIGTEAYRNLNPEWLAKRFNYDNRNIKKPLFGEERKTNIYLIIGTKNLKYIIDGEGDGAVSMERATLPWFAKYNKEYFGLGSEYDLTEPVNIENNGDFPVNHFDLVKKNEIYQRAVSLIAPKVITKSINGGRLQNNENIQASMVNADTLLTVFFKDVKIPASTTEIYKAYFSKSGPAYFRGVLQNAGATFFLKSPSGEVYDTSNSGYFFEKNLGLHSYEILNAESGEWEITLKGGNTITHSRVKAVAKSNRRVNILTEKYNYLPNEAITLNVNFTSNNLPITGGNGIVYLFKGTTQDSIQVFDDGIHNDGNADDGVYGNEYLGFKEVGFVSLVAKLQKGLESTINEGSIVIMTISGVFTDKYSVQTLDKNYDNLYDSLQIKVGVNIKEAGNFMVMGSLKDSKGNSITTASWSNIQANPLSKGNYDIILNFDGEEIGKSKEDGPYILDDLVLTDISNSNIVDSRDFAYVTEPYKSRDFTRPPIQLTGKNTETPVDIDNDGDYDYLDIKIQVDVTQSGYYSVNAELLDSLQNSLNWAVNETYFYTGLNEITLRFSGEEINEKLADGPYLLTNLYFDSYYAAKTFFDVYKTSKYLFSNFTGNIITGKVKDSYTGLGVEGATVILKGDKLATAKTDKNGSYALAGLPNGYYTLEVQKDNYCTSNIIRINYLQANVDTSFQIINQKIVLNPSKDLQICQGDSVKFTLPTGLTDYKWSTGSTNNNITVKNAGEYFVTAQKEGCQIESDTVKITLKLVSKPTIISDGYITLTSSAADSYQWSNNDIIIAGATNQTYTINTSGKYSVRVSQNGCFNTSDYFNFVVTAEEPKLNIIPVKLYPNPNNGSFWIEVPENTKTWNIDITDLKGSTVFNKKSVSNYKLFIDTELQTGTYLIRIISDRKYNVIKLVIK